MQYRQGPTSWTLEVRTQTLIMNVEFPKFNYKIKKKSVLRQQFNSAISQTAILLP